MSKERLCRYEMIDNSEIVNTVRRSKELYEGIE